MLFSSVCVCVGGGGVRPVVPSSGSSHDWVMLYGIIQQNHFSNEYKVKNNFSLLKDWLITLMYCDRLTTDATSGPSLTPSSTDMSIRES